MKLFLETSAKQITVTLAPVEKKDQNGRQRTERDTGRPMWSTQVFILDDDGGEVIAVTTAGEKPNVMVGQPVLLSKLEALPWSTNGRSGVAYRATEIKTAMTSVKTA
jgi:outer membrane protein assembly factor BamB